MPHNAELFSPEELPTARESREARGQVDAERCTLQFAAPHERKPSEFDDAPLFGGDRQKEALLMKIAALARIAGETLIIAAVLFGYLRCVQRLDKLENWAIGHIQAHAEVSR